MNDAPELTRLEQLIYGFDMNFKAILDEIFPFILFGGFGILCLLSIYRSYLYGRDSGVWWRGLLRFWAYLILAGGAFFALCGGTFAVAGFMGGGNGQGGALIGFTLSTYAFWYGILNFGNRKENKYLLTGWIAGMLIFGAIVFEWFEVIVEMTI